MINSLFIFFIDKNIIKFIVFWNLFIIVIYPESLDIHPFYLSNKKPILEYDGSKVQTLIKGRNFLDNCLKIPNKKKYKFTKKPKISVIVPMFNCEKTIKPTLRSIQNQNMSKIEILLINDFSSDNTFKIINKISKNDKRIKIINNHKNMGTLFSRCIGALISKGEYI